MKIKKLFIAIFYLLLVVVIGTQTTHAADLEYKFNATTREVKNYNDIVHMRMIGQMTLGTTTTNQHYNYIGANLKNSDYRVIAADNYQPFAWGMSPLTGLIYNAENRFPQIQVYGGINADFYDINNTGRATNHHIINFEVYHRGGKNANAVGFLDDGSVIFGNPTHQGQHINILGKDSELKNRIKIDRTNQLPQNDLEVAIFFENYGLEIPAELPKVVVKASDIKIAGDGTRSYAKGVLLEHTTEAVTVKERTFVLVGKTFQDENLVTDSDTILVQELLGNGFENARFAVGVGAPLVVNGNIDANVKNATPSGRHPRTAIGLTKEGIVFFVVVDGRAAQEGKDGVTLEELAYIMKSHGAQSAYNLDGGGSSTMMLDTTGEGDFEVLNTLSDGRLRSISNGLLFVKGDFAPMFTEVSYPDMRSPFDSPSNLYVTNEGVLGFTGVESAYYDVKVVNTLTAYTTQYTVAKEQLSLIKLNRGTYSIQVRIRGNSQFSGSEWSAPFIYNVHSDEINSLLDLFKNIA